MKSGRSIIWAPKLDLETEERIRFLNLSSEEKWEFMMKIIMVKHPTNKVTYKKRLIEWT